MAKSLDWQTEVARHQVCSSIINNFIMMMYKEQRGMGEGEAAFARCLSLSIRYFSVPQRLIQIAFAMRVVAVTVAIPEEGRGVRG